MKKVTVVCCMLATMLAACTNSKLPETTVHLKGQLIDMGSTEVRMRYDGAASMIGDTRDIILNTDSEGRFDTIVNLDQPEYYSISRNTLYLTPGDEMTIKVTNLNDEAEFIGKGAIANTYMKKRLFPKGGSFLNAGENVKNDFASTKALVDSLAVIRLNELNALDSVSDEFKALEKARINADVINSYISYAWYSDIMENVKSDEEAVAEMKVFAQSIAPEVNELYKEVADDKYLDVAVVRDVLSYSTEPDYAAWFEGIAISDRIKELYSADKEVGKLRSRADKETVDEVSTFAKTMKNTDFAAELNNKILQTQKLLPGQPAFDIVLQTVDGTTKKMSDFKGQNIYVDLWATWCGPCIQESPYFEELSKKYMGKDIVFLPISTDADKKTWLGYLGQHKKNLVQYNSQDRALGTDWAVFYIPRFILIDKDFNIVNAYAPRPSSEEISKVIDNMLQR